MDTTQLSELIVNQNDSIKKAMHAIDYAGKRMCLIADNNGKLIGLVTDGDIRRKIMEGIDINTPVKEIANKNPITVKKGDSEKLDSDNVIAETIIKTAKSRGGIDLMPIIDEHGKIAGLLSLSELIKKKSSFLTEMEKEDIIKNIPRGKKRVLVIGGAGYIGSVLCRKLLEKGCNVRVLDNLTYGEHGIKELYASHSDNSFELVKGDIRNIHDVVKAVIGCDAVILLAAIVGDPACSIDPITTVENNYLATKMIGEVCKHHQVNRLVFASTCSTYGMGSSVLDENSPLNPVSLYARSKIDSEKALLELMDENFSPTILRLATIYGYSPRMRFDLVVNIMTAKAIKEKKIQIFGGQQWRPLVHVGDAADAFIKCIESPIAKIRGQVFNVGSSEQNCQIIKIGEMVRDAFPGIKMEILKEDADKRDYNVSFDKIKKVLNFAPKMSVQKSIKEIKQAFDDGKIGDYNDKIYSNYGFLK